MRVSLSIFKKTVTVLWKLKKRVNKKKNKREDPFKGYEHISINESLRRAESEAHPVDNQPSERDFL